MGDRTSIYYSPRADATVISTRADEFVDGAYEDWDLSFASIVESINDGILVVRFDGTIIYVNPRMGQMLGYDPREVVGSSVFEFMDEQWRKKIRDRLEERRQGKEGEYDHQVRHRDGHPLWLHISARPVRDAQGRPRCSLVAAQDITDRKEMEKKLLQARTKAEEASRAKGDFLARMSHEIRTPMNGVVGMLELLEGTKLNSEQQRYLHTAREAADGLLSLINDILDLSKIEARRLELSRTTFSLRDQVSETLQTLAREAAKKDLELVYFVDEEIPDLLIGDPDRLRQVLVNLVKNSIKFTDEGQISVLAAVDEVEEDGKHTIYFAVSDTGRGIPEEQREQIFEAFHQAGAREHSPEGTGLGLTIAAQLVGLMGGKLWLDSEEGLGSTFHFTARFDAVDEAGRKEGRQVTPLTGVPVLVVDTNAVNRHFLQTLLSSWGMRPTVVGELSAAADVLEDVSSDAPFELFVIGVHHFDGKEVEEFDEFRRRISAQDVPVIALSPTGVVPQPEWMQRHGIARHLFKPLRPSTLLETICELLDVESTVQRQTEVRPPQPVHKSLRILVAEDNPVNQRVTAGLLEKRGHDVEVVSNGRRAVERLVDEKEDFDLVLMDIQMPEMDGYEATGEIRRREARKGRHTPIIALTAHAMSGDRERILAAGMDGYLSKPVTADELYESIEAVEP